MGISKTMLFTVEENLIADFAKAIAHPARIAIIKRLLKTETCICGDFVQDLGLAQSTISQHLVALKKIGLVQGTVQGPSTCYCINVKQWNKLKQIIGNFIDEETTEQSVCC